MDTTVPQFVLDFEALAFGENAIVTRIACTPFRFDEKDITYEELVTRTFYVALDTADQKNNYGRTMDRSTLKWWSEQTPELQKESMKKTDHDLSLKDAIDQLHAFAKKWKYSKWNSFIWARGSFYETCKYQTMAESIYPNDRTYLNTFKFHECRTFNWMLTQGETECWEPNPMPASFQKHNAKHDAAMDAFRLVRLFND